MNRVGYFFACARNAVRCARVSRRPETRALWLRSAQRWRELAKDTRAHERERREQRTYVHGCWVYPLHADVCADGTKGCVRTHPRREPTE